MSFEGRLRKPTAVRVIVLGDERGDSGKSTAAMHLAIALSNLGQRVVTKPPSAPGPVSPTSRPGSK